MIWQPREWATITTGTSGAAGGFPFPGAAPQASHALGHAAVDLLVDVHLLARLRDLLVGNRVARRVDDDSRNQVRCHPKFN